jgi:hypothetical protein
LTLILGQQDRYAPRANAMLTTIASMRIPAEMLLTEGGLPKLASWRFIPRHSTNRSCLSVKLASEKLEGEFLNFLRRLRLYPNSESNNARMAAKAWAAVQGDAGKDLRRLEARLDEQKKRKRKLLDSMLDGKISDITYKEADEEFCAEIAAMEKDLRALDSRQVTQEAFVRFAKLHTVDVAGAWQLATVEQKYRVQTFLFEGGLSYSEKNGILNRSNSCLFSTLELLSGSKVNLASPTGFEPVLSP